MHHPIDRITYTTAFVTPVVGHWLERDDILYMAINKKITEEMQYITFRILFPLQDELGWGFFVFFVVGFSVFCFVFVCGGFEYRQGSFKSTSSLTE